MSDIQSLIKMLQNNNPDKRYYACEELRVSPSLPPEALDALRLVTNDANPDVADAAQRALALHAEMKKEPELESSSENDLQSNKALGINDERHLTYSIIAGAIGGFLITLFFTIAMNSVGQKTDLNPLESLFLDAAIFENFFDGASIFVFILTRVLTGGVFGYLAYLILRRKKLSTVIFGAFLAGLFGGAIMLSCVVALSVQ